MDTIFALSSGSPPAAIGVIRISGPRAGAALQALAGRIPDPRMASLAILRGGGGQLLDRALVLWFPGPASATGEDCAEIHCHGGRAVVGAIGDALAELEGLRAAQAGEFTRRAFANGRIDLAEAEGLADLLSAETELQRAVAMSAAGGELSVQLSSWRDRLLGLAAQVESALDFSDEDDVEDLPEAFHVEQSALANELREFLDRPRTERLRDGVRVVLAGPPNSGKSTLFNAILQSDAAIVSPIAGTTRDAIERPVAIEGVPLVMVDTAGLRDATEDEIERVGIDRAMGELERADIVLWLGEEGRGPENALEIATRADCDENGKDEPDYVVSGRTGAGVDTLGKALAERARALMPAPGDVAVNGRQAAILAEARDALSAAGGDDLLLQAENLRVARVAFDRLLGTASTEDMLDALFGRFCIGK